MLDKLNYGDIVTIEDYAGHYFRITQKQTHIYETEGLPEEYEYMVELECVHTGIPHLAYVDEIEVVSTKAEAEAFLADKPAPEMPSGGIAVMFTPWGEERESPTGPPLTPKSRATIDAERQARIDVLIDEWSDNATKAQAVGDEGGFYARRNSEVEAEIKELTANGIR